MNIKICVIGFLLSCHVFAGKSITGQDVSYKEICLLASADPVCLAQFRSLPGYSHILEVGNEQVFGAYIMQNASKETLKKIDIFQRLDGKIGDPIMADVEGLGKFSGTTLRYIIIADQIKKLFQLPDKAVIVEIGAGFGGQCFVLSQLQSISKYYIYDLPEVEKLIEKVSEVMGVKGVQCMPLEDNIPEEHVDLLVSNYAFSECDRETQLEYFNRVMKKAERGYVIYNQTAAKFYGLDSLSPAEFVSLLTSHGMRPQIYNEPVPTFAGNLLIVWGILKNDSKVGV